MQNEQIEDSAEKSRTMTVLGSIMALPFQDQVSLSRAWQAMAAPGVFFSGSSPSDLQSTLSSPAVVEEVVTPAEWLAGISTLPHREQLLLIEDALAEAEGADEKMAFQAAIADIKSRDVPLAVEMSVTRLAYDRPWFVALGLLAVLLGIWKFGGSVLKFFS